MNVDHMDTNQKTNIHVRHRLYVYFDHKVFYLNSFNNGKLIFIIPSCFCKIQTAVNCMVATNVKRDIYSTTEVCITANGNLFLKRNQVTLHNRS